MLKKLKILNLSHSHHLTRSPDFSKLPKLEKLILKGCERLSKVHQSIGHLEGLALVNLKDCKMLKELPMSFYQLKAIETLILSGCSKFDNLMKDLGLMVSLRTLLADNTAIREIPSSIIQLSNLEYLSLCGLKQRPSKLFLTRFWSHLLPRRCVKYPTSLSGLYALKELYVRDCNLNDSSLPKDLESLSCLEPSKPQGPPKLVHLLLDNCTNLHAIPELPTNLAVLRADGCTALERMPNFSEMLSIRQLNLSDSPKLSDIPGFGYSSYLLEIEMEGCINISRTLKEKLQQRGSYADNFGGNFLPGNDIPPRFMYVNEGGILSFQVPPNIGSNLKAFTLYIVYSCSSKNRENVNSIFIQVINHTKHTVFFVRPSSRPKEIISSGYLARTLLKQDVDMIRSLPYAHFRRENDDEGGITSTSRGVAVTHQQINFNKCIFWCLIAAIACSYIFCLISN
ncbi:hypothetical protein ACLB2K_050728 [Fragaria x ananassa]